MKIAIPLAAGRLSLHFGHCDQFAIIDVDPESNEILGREDLASPPHEPGLLPRWLSEKGASMIIAGGMGVRAQQLFAQNGVQVVIGAPADTPENLVQQMLSGELQGGPNPCDH